MAGSGGAISNDSASSTWVVNSILWGNMPNEIVLDAGTCFADYSDIQGGFDGGVGNINQDPQFEGKPYESGYWVDVFYDDTKFWTELSVSGTPWQAGELAGMFVQPNTDVTDAGVDYRIFPIENNTSNTIYIWGDIETILGLVGTEGYTIFDLYLDSTSPCIDSAAGPGAPEFDFYSNGRYDHSSHSNAYSCATPPPDAGIDAGQDASCYNYVDMGAFEFWPSP